MVGEMGRIVTGLGLGLGLALGIGGNIAYLGTWRHDLRDTVGYGGIWSLP